MSDGIELRDKLAWNRTSSLMALMANCNLDPKKGRTVSPADYNPYLQGQRKRQTRVIEVNDAESRALFKTAVMGTT
jgi:hypothetical protein